ncbi:MAG: PspC domain-containing protein [bacterium]|nr:PspC domain-containing protein [Candidatus Kapabacteria bacterium]
MDVAIARIIFGALLFAGIGLPLYILCWIAVPKEPSINVDEFGFVEDRPRSSFGTLFKIILLLIVGAIVVSHVDRDIAIVAFIIGLCVGLYYLWRNRANDDAEVSSVSVGKLYRSESNKKILGVFGGLGDTLGVDPTLLRVLGGIVLIAGFPIIVPMYLLFAIVVPVRRVIIL